MGGYNSGRKSGGEKTVEDFYSLYICWLCQQGLLEPGRRAVVRFGKAFAIKLECKTNFWGWEQCLHIRYPAWNRAGKIETRVQIVGFEWRNTLNGKTRRPYFFCPILEIQAGKLLMGNNGFAHRTWYGPLYHGQTLGHFDRSIRTCSAIRNKLGSAATELATALDRSKGMHKNTCPRYLKTR